MSLTKKQKNFILSNKNKMNYEKISGELNVSIGKIKEFADGKSKAPGYFYFILLLIPLMFFVLLEIGLKMFNYGYNLNQWVNVTKSKLVLNTDIAYKYFFNTENVPYSNQDAFDEVKMDNTFRVFVLGGSAAAGYPFSPIGSFSRYLQDRLSLIYPESKIEVVNCSMTAVNSYTIRDFTPGILEQKPDLIIIYAGHNEYYGALGVGSMENLGTSRSVVNFVISLEKFKTFQLLRDIIKSAVGLFSRSKSLSGTLMSRMAQNQFIAFQSDIYNKGLSQFEGNMTDVLEMARRKNIPVILGTLTCNLRDQKPFVSVPDSRYPPADKVFAMAKNELKKGNNQKADSLFGFARDLDALRFRAPGKINKIIKNLGKKFNYSVVNIDSAFIAITPDHIVGDNLMTDHLHPTLTGYMYMGKTYFDEMKRLNFMPKSTPKNISDRIQDSLTISNFHFSKLDSVIGDYRVRLLKNDWPFKNKNEKLPDHEVLMPKDHIDSVAAKFLIENSNWEEAHRKLAEWYINKNDIYSFLDLMNVLIAQYPIIYGYYDYIANELLNRYMYDEAYIYLKKRFDEQPNAFSAKWLGIIDLSKNKFESAKKYLMQCLKYDKKDSQVYYNLSGCYVSEGNYKLALETNTKALELNPNYIEAKNLQTQLTNAVKTEELAKDD